MKKTLNWNQHIGVYSYRIEALRKFLKFPLSPLEDREKLEQLRALENGQTIGAHICFDFLIGVDQPSDIKKVEEVLNV
jgi:3-deoxy-manno-octulosonate cytidylyltransferase (CMP-KDO synthetase)